VRLQQCCAHYVDHEWGFLRHQRVLSDVSRVLRQAMQHQEVKALRLQEVLGFKVLQSPSLRDMLPFLQDGRAAGSHLPVVHSIVRGEAALRR
jgi:hypothetical protein